MKKTILCLLCLISVLLPPVLAGCSDQEQVSPVIESETETEPEIPTVLGAEILPSAEITELKNSREQLASDAEHMTLYFNGAETARIGSSRFFVTVPLPEDENLWPAGAFSGPEGYRVIIDSEMLPEDPAAMIEAGDGLTVYLFGGNDYTSAEVVLTYLPVISIDIDNGAELSHSLQGADFAVFDNASENKLKRYTGSRAEVTIRGGSSSGLPKKSIRIDLKDENGENHDMSFCGMRKDDDWILTAMYSDESKIRDMTAWQIWREMNSYYPGVSGSCAPDARYAEVILNGEYQGLYIFMEKFDAKTMKLENGDVLFKAASWDVPDSAGLKKQSPRSRAYMAMEKKWPDSQLTVEGTWDRIAEYIRAAYETDGKGFSDSIADAAAIENQLDYWIFNNVTMAGDNTFKNAYYAVRDGLVYTLPWDLDISFGLNWNGDPATNYLYRDPGCVTRTYDFQVGRRLLKYCAEAADYVRNRWTELMEAGVLTAENINGIAEEYRNLICSSGAVTRECERWPEGSYAEELTYFKKVVTRRIDWLDEYIGELK